MTWMISNRSLYDSLLQLLQHDVTGDYSMSLTNQFIGTDVVLNDLSISGYEDMMFNVKSPSRPVSTQSMSSSSENPKTNLLPIYLFCRYNLMIKFDSLLANDTIYCEQ